jgi:ParB family chromosome partitioning protein
MSKAKPAGLSAGLVGVNPGARAGLVAKGAAVAPTAVQMAQPVATLAAQSADAHPVSARKLEIVSHSSPGTLPIGGIAEVDIARCHMNPYGARQKYPASLIEARANSIAKEGQKYEVIVCPHPEITGDWIIVDGECRKRALLHLARTTIRIKNDGPKTNKELYRLSLLLNKERNNGSVIDDALVWQKMLDDKIVESQDDLAEMAGVSKGSVSKTLSILKLPTYALQLIADSDAAERLTLLAAYELHLVTKYLEPNLLIEVIEKVLAGQVSARDLEAMRARYDAGRTRKTKEISRQYKIKTEGAQVGFLKEWDSGKVAFEINLADPLKRMELMMELKRRFGLNEA